MTTDRAVQYLMSLVRELCKLPHETEWVEAGFICPTIPKRLPN
jgi:hypothetical protein